MIIIKIIFPLEEIQCHTSALISDAILPDNHKFAV